MRISDKKKGSPIYAKVDLNVAQTEHTLVAKVIEALERK